jgi:hypothetical protein
MISWCTSSQRYGPRPGLDRTPAQIAAVERAVREFAATLGTPIVIGLDAAMDPQAPTSALG